MFQLLPVASVLSLGGDNVASGVMLTIVFSSVGILMMLIGLKLVDLVTPGKLTQEIIEKRNIAAAIITGSMMIGIGLVIAAALIG